MAWPGVDDRHNNGEAELALDNANGLPWLESGEEDYEEGAVDPRKIIIFAILVLAILGLGIGGAWWYFNRGADTQFVADGSIIAAPQGPYKERPEDAGGKTFAGTGNLAPAVAEGEGREVILAEREVISPPDAQDSAAQNLAGPATNAAPAGVGVQVGAYGSHGRAQAGWATLRRQTTALDGVRHRIIKGQADIGTVYRLQAVTADLATARSLCDALRADGLACQVKP